MYSSSSSDTRNNGIRLSKRDKTYVDISLTFEPNALNGDITTLRDTRAIDNSLKNIIMTMPLETPFNSDMGSEVTSMMFDPVDFATSGLLELDIERAIRFNEPRVEVINVFVRPYDDQLLYEVDIEYKIVGTEQIYIVSQILTATR
jgi:Phage baseplate assembly protein W